MALIASGEPSGVETCEGAAGAWEGMAPIVGASVIATKGGAVGPTA